MPIQESICPLCGNPSPQGAVCGRCRVKATCWFTCPPRIPITACPTCGARKDAGVWSDGGEEREEVVRSLVSRSILFHPDLHHPAVEMVIHDMSSNRSRVDCTVRGTLYSEPVEGSCTIEVEWKKEQCDRCSRISGSYYEGIVQVRGTGRRLSSREVEETRVISQGILESLVAAGERLAFISEWDEHRDGVDITVGSQRLGQEIASAVTRALGGRFTTHPKLVGEKAGKQIYRVTYSVRLPRYSRGDLVVVRGRYAEVTGIEGRLFRCTDLDSGAQKLVPEAQVERLVGKRSDATPWLVVFRDRDLVGVMDPATGLTREIPAPLRADYPPGTTVRVFLDKDKPVILE
ncbi:MAG: 60S ribosomal export protein NMD3 [Methanolinea sp.]|nr:60S ribosomal export protein NMD3 [Methanolinea sp.]